MCSQLPQHPPYLHQDLNMNRRWRSVAMLDDPGCRSLLLENADGGLTARIRSKVGGC